MRRKLPIILLCAALLLPALDMRLAQPERRSPQQDNFIGFFLSYERMPQPGELIPVDRTHWVEYGSEAMHIDGLGSVAFPRMILIGEKVDGRYEFPGLEGYNCFLSIQTDEEDGTRYISGYTDMADSHASISDTGKSLSGAVYFGPPLDDSNWNTENYDYCWTAYRVYQMEDGTVYLDGTGNSYGGVGGFSISEKREWTTTMDGETTTSSFEVSVKINSIPRLESVAVRQFDKDDQLLRTDILTARQAASLGEEGLHLPLDENTAYAIVVETDVEGNVSRDMHEVAASGDRAIYFVSWFLKEDGMGYSVPVLLQPEGETDAPQYTG